MDLLILLQEPAVRVALYILFALLLLDVAIKRHNKAKEIKVIPGWAVYKHFNHLSHKGEITRSPKLDITTTNKIANVESFQSFREKHYKRIKDERGTSITRKRNI